MQGRLCACVCQGSLRRQPTIACTVEPPLGVSAALHEECTSTRDAAVGRWVTGTHKHVRDACDAVFSLKELLGTHADGEHLCFPARSLQQAPDGRRPQRTATRREAVHAIPRLVSGVCGMSRRQTPDVDRVTAPSIQRLASGAWGGARWASVGTQ